MTESVHSFCLILGDAIVCLGLAGRLPATAFNRMAPVWRALGLALTEIEVRP